MEYVGADEILDVYYSLRAGRLCLRPIEAGNFMLPENIHLGIQMILFL
jgi:hypothetical protein